MNRGLGLCFFPQRKKKKNTIASPNAILMFFLPFYLLWFLEILWYFNCRQISVLEGKLYVKAIIKTHLQLLYTVVFLWRPGMHETAEVCSQRTIAKSHPFFCRTNCRLWAHSFNAMNCPDVADSLSFGQVIFFCCLAVGRFSRGVFRAEQMAFEDQFHGESWSLLSLLWLMLLASCLTLLESTARGRQAWTSATRPRPHVTHRWEWHMVVQPESHTSAATSTTAVNHLAESPTSKQALIPATLCDFNHFGETGGFSPWDVQSKQSNKKLGNAVLIVSQPLGGKIKKNKKKKLKKIEKRAG